MRHVDLRPSENVDDRRGEDFAVAADLAATARCSAASCIRALVTNVSGARLTVRLG
ncbi:MAG: hypothetical protein NTX21_12445 [Alphaproteobacteria bacterium]|nr:hypothetical protein [Alphaproteobacteria bacterium]